MKRSYLLIIASLVVLIIAAGCTKQVFSGSFTGNDKQFIMDYSVLNCTKTHEIKLQEGTAINAIIENKSGRLSILVADANGEEIYRGDNAASGKFSLTIPKTETYKFSVTGSKAKGSVSFKVAE
jgi:hypothetical protein